MGEPSYIEKLQSRLAVALQYVRELEEQIERERNPAARHAKPKLTVIKGGLSAFVGPFVVAGHFARDNAIQTAAVAAFAVGVPAGSIIAETPLPADAGQRVTSSIQAPHDGIPVSPDGDAAISAASPGSEALPPGIPTPASTPTPGLTPAPVAQQIMPFQAPPVTIEPLPDLATIEPLPEPTLEPEPVPTPSPSPTGTEPALETPKNAGLAHVEAVDACLAEEGPPKMQDCLAALVS